MAHIYLIAPSWKVPPEDLVQTKAFFISQGFQVTLPEDLIGEDLLCANTDDQRAFFVKQALQDPSVDIIWSLSGGYGMSRILPQLLSLSKPKKEKIYIGYSDGTALHLFLNQHWGWSSLHGPSARQIAKKTIGVASIQQTLDLISGQKVTQSGPAIFPLNEKAGYMKTIEGPVIGGNLCLIQCSLGAPWQINPKGKILFLEDVDERGYRIDRMLSHLYQAGVLKEIKAVLLGDFTGGLEGDGTSLIPPVLSRFAEEAPFPVFRLPNVGHGNENLPLPLNMPLIFPISPSLDKAF